VPAWKVSRADRKLSSHLLGLAPSGLLPRMSIAGYATAPGAGKLGVRPSERSPNRTVRIRTRRTGITAILVVGLIAIAGTGLASAGTGRLHASSAPLLTQTGGGQAAAGDGDSPAANSSSLHWEELSPTAPAPPPRSAAAVAYDPLLHSVVLFGGYFVQVEAAGDTWEFTNGAWTDVTPSDGNSPSPRWSATITYDAAIGALVLFGGRNTEQFFNDTWIFDASGWHQVSTPTAPSPRITTMTYDASFGAVVLFGGGIGNLPAGSESPWSHYSDTWEFMGTTWRNLSAGLSVAPRAVSAVGLVYDAAGGYDLLLGGVSDACAENILTWTFQDGSWTNRTGPVLTGPGGANGIAGFGLTYDPLLNAVLTFGGNVGSPSGGCYSIDGTWEYSGGVWTNLTATLGPIAPAGRAAFQFTFNSAAGYAFLFGGNIDNSYAYLGDTWGLTSNQTGFGQSPGNGHSAPGWVAYVLPGTLVAVLGFLGAFFAWVLIAQRKRPPSGLQPSLPPIQSPPLLRSPP
jgi:Galactose oxidase, central domain